METIESAIRRDIEKGLIPKYIYKFRDIETTKKILENTSLKFASPTDFNDPFECKANIETQATFQEISHYLQLISGKRVTRKGIRKKARECCKKASEFNKIIQERINKSSKETGICCFSEQPDNILMWSHYAQSHKGTCFKFDITNDINFFSLPLYVIYSTEFPSYNLILDHDEMVKKQILTKAINWEYEKEIRVIKTHNVGFHKFKKESLCEIIFGCSTDKNSIDEIKEIIIKNNYPKVIFKQAKMRKKEYALDIITI